MTFSCARLFGEERMGFFNCRGAATTFKERRGMRPSDWLLGVGCVAVKSGRASVNSISMRSKLSGTIVTIRVPVSVGD